MFGYVEYFKKFRTVSKQNGAIGKKILSCVLSSGSRQTIKLVKFATTKPKALMLFSVKKEMAMGISCVAEEGKRLVEGSHGC